MPRSDMILFLDLETTGADRHLDDIIEVGLALYSWPAFEEISAGDWLVRPSQAAYDRMVAEPVVKAMHEKNGLLSEITQLMENEPPETPLSDDSRHRFPMILDTAFRVSPAGVDAEIDAWLSEYGTRNSPHIPLGGSGVSHFDRPFVQKHLPLLDQRLSYWAYDVGVLRRMFLLAGARYPSADDKTHRALADARQHAEEFKFYMGKITEMFGALRAEADAAKE